MQPLHKPSPVYRRNLLHFSRFYQSTPSYPLRQMASFHQRLNDAAIQRQEAADDHQLTLVSLERSRREKALLDDEVVALRGEVERRAKEAQSHAAAEDANKKRVSSSR